VTYTVTVLNTGVVPITDITVDDSLITGSGSPPEMTCASTSLASEESTTCTGTYILTQADVDAGAVRNTAVATGFDTEGVAVVSNPGSADIEIPAAPSLTLTKVADPTGVLHPGETVTYTYTVTNSGNTTITGVAVQETSFTGSGTRASISCLASTLSPSQSTTCTSTYTVTQADIDRGSILNSAVATGFSGTMPIASNAASATVTVLHATLGLVKRAVAPLNPTTGDTITYNVTVTNTGDVPIDNITAFDTVFSGSGPPPVIVCPRTTLDPG